jgi:hypothetical protein
VIDHSLASRAVFRFRALDKLLRDMRDGRTPTRSAQRRRNGHLAAVTRLEDERRHEHRVAA